MVAGSRALYDWFCVEDGCAASASIVSVRSGTACAAVCAGGGAEEAFPCRFLRLANWRDSRPSSIE